MSGFFREQLNITVMAISTSQAAPMVMIIRLHSAVPKGESLKSLTLAWQQIFHVWCLPWYHAIYTLLWVERSVWRDNHSLHKSTPWIIDADDRQKIACIKPSKLLVSVRDFIENTPQQEITCSNEWTRNMFKLTNTQTHADRLCGVVFVCFFFFNFYFIFCLVPKAWLTGLDAGIYHFSSKQIGNEH